MYDKHNRMLKVKILLTNHMYDNDNAKPTVMPVALRIEPRTSILNRWQQTSPTSAAIGIIKNVKPKKAVTVRRKVLMGKRVSTTSM